MRSEWVDTTLGEVYEFASGLSKGAKEFGFGFPFLSFKTVFNNYFIPDTILELANTTAQEQERCSIKVGDVFLTRTSETMNELGMSCIALHDYPFATFNGFTKRLRPKDILKIYPKYAAFYFRSGKFRNIVSSYVTMSTRASLNNETLCRLPITLPSFDEQKSIGDLLFSLYQKIELNNKINANLEAQAQAIFKSWFVDFEPFQEGEFAEIPLGGVFSFINGYAFKSKDYLSNGKYKIITIKNVQDGYIDTTNTSFLNAYPNKMSKNVCLSIGDVLLSLTGNVGRVGIVCESDLLMNQRVAKFYPQNPNYLPFFYFLFRSSSVKEYLISIAKGTAQLNLSPIETLNMPIIYNEDIIKKFSNTVEPLMNRIINNNIQSRALADLRDTLLPKLMSGEIKVPLEAVYESK